MERKYLEDLLKNKDMIYDPSFFVCLKSTSLLDFRKNINMVQEIFPSLYIEEKVMEYYEELLAQYDENKQIFLEYYKWIECFQKNDYAFLDQYHDFNYFIDESMLIQLSDYWHYSDRMELVYDYFMKCTSHKISEIIVDGLFQDTIYNVWMNLKEMLRYHDSLDSREKVISEERVEFYRSILNIDKIDSNEKIEMYHMFKDKKMALMFYEDWNLMKKHSYIRMKNSLFRLEDQKHLWNQVESNQYDVPVYELDGDDFYMMIRCSNAYSSTSSSIRDCYSLISSYHMEVFAKNRFIYGYINFDTEDIVHVLETDACSSDQLNDHTFTTKYVNRIMSPKQICDSPGYSEIQIKNKRKKDDTNIFEGLKPNYLVVFDHLEEKYIVEAKRLEIPIVKINTSKYLSKMKEGYDSRNQLGFDKFERVFDSYTSGRDLEKERRSRR